MNIKTCLTDHDLILHYYGELGEEQQVVVHLAHCSLCTERLASLQMDLDRMPAMNRGADPKAGTRMAARVKEQLNTPRRRLWVPALGATTVAALALLVTFSQPPQPEQQQITKSSPTKMATMYLDEDMPDIDFLEDLELLQELELLAQIEGV